MILGIVASKLRGGVVSIITTIVGDPIMTIAGDLITTSETSMPTPINELDVVDRQAINDISGLINVKNYGVTGDGATDDLPALQAIIDGLPSPADSAGGREWRGTEIYFPAGRYFLDGELYIDKQCILTGAGNGSHYYSAPTTFTFPANTTGIRLVSSHSNDGGAEEQASTSLIRNLFLYCLSQDTTGHGIHASTLVKLHNVTAQNFAGNGCNIVASVFDSSGNASHWYIQDSVFIGNGGDGLHVSGSDTSTGNCINSNMKANGGWGIYDYSHFGNTYHGIHLGGNAKGTVKTSTGGSVFIKTYVEGAPYQVAEMQSNTLIENGGLAQCPGHPHVVVTGDGNGAILRSYVKNGIVQNVQVVSRGSGYTAATCSDKTGQGQIGSGGTGAAYTVNLKGGEVDSITVVKGGAGYEGNTYNVGLIQATSASNGGGFITNKISAKCAPSSEQYNTLDICGKENVLLSCPHGYAAGGISFLKWDNGKKTYNQTLGKSDASSLIQQRICTEESATETGGRGDALPAGSIEFPNGIWLEDGDSGRLLSVRSAMPTSGEYAKGDFIINSNPSEAGNPAYIVHGWKRYVTGSNHILGTDWKEIKAFTGELNLNTPNTTNTQTGATYDVILTDNGKMITMENASANVVTIPSDAEISFPIGSELHFMQLGVGVTMIAITADTLNIEASLTLALAGQYAVATAKKVEPTLWVLFGNLEEA